MTDKPTRESAKGSSVFGNHGFAVAFAAGLGAALAIGAMELLSAEFNYPLAIIPFATSIVLVIGSPDLPAAQPRALIGGHVISTLVGLAF